jgi:chromate transporter
MTQSAHAPRDKTDLFVSFTLLALQGFGGVLAVVQRELVEKKQWLTPEEFIEDWAVAQTLPGPNVVNLSLMIGGRYFGLAGALAALAGILAAPTAIALLLAAGLAGVADSALAQNSLRGMGAVSAGLIMATGIKLVSALKTNPMGRIACLGIATLTFIGIGLLRWPLAWVLPGLGSLACAWAWVCLKKPSAP